MQRPWLTSIGCSRRNPNPNPNPNSNPNPKVPLDKACNGYLYSARDEGTMEVSAVVYVEVLPDCTG